MKVLQLHTRYRESGGEDVAVATDAALLRAAGHTVVTHVVENPAGRVTATSHLAAAPWNPASARRVLRVARKVQPDIVHVHNTWFALSPAIFPILRRDAPVVVTLHNYRLLCAAATLFRDGAPCEDCVGTHPWHAVRHRCYRASTVASTMAAATIAVHHARGTWHRDVDRFLALTAFGRDRFIAGGLPADRISIASNSVADPGPRPAPPSSSPDVLYVGRLSPEKGIGALVAAWRHAPQHLRLLVIGDGPMAARLRSIAPVGVQFLGHLPAEEVTARMRSARALVFPSMWYEGQGLVALEAAAAGLPVLHSDLGVMPELFAPDVEPLRFRSTAAGELGRALSALADDGFVNRYGAVTRRRFEERYTRQIAARRLQDIYRDVLRKRQVPSREGSAHD